MTFEKLAGEATAAKKVMSADQMLANLRLHNIKLRSGADNED